MQYISGYVVFLLSLLEFTMLTLYFVVFCTSLMFSALVVLRRPDYKSDLRECAQHELVFVMEESDCFSLHCIVYPTSITHYSFENVYLRRKRMCPFVSILTHTGKRNWIGHSFLQIQSQTIHSAHPKRKREREVSVESEYWPCERA